MRGQNVINKQTKGATERERKYGKDEITGGGDGEKCASFWSNV